MNRSELHTIASRIAAALDALQDVVCQHVLRTLAQTGEPIVPAHLAERLHMSKRDLAAHLIHIPDAEFDTRGNLVGWGLTLVPTAHQFLLAERSLFAWCAFDTVLFPPLLQQSARVRSVCAATGHPITFVATAEGEIREVLPKEARLSLVVPEQHLEGVRGVFCVDSLFFESEQAATTWLDSHPGAITLSLEEAASVGQAVARR